MIVQGSDAYLLCAHLWKSLRVKGEVIGGEDIQFSQKGLDRLEFLLELEAKVSTEFWEGFLKHMTEDFNGHIASRVH